MSFTSSRRLWQFSEALKLICQLTSTCTASGHKGSFPVFYRSCSWWCGSWWFSSHSVFLFAFLLAVVDKWRRAVWQFLSWPSLGRVLRCDWLPCQAQGPWRVIKTSDDFLDVIDHHAKFRAFERQVTWWFLRCDWSPCQVQRLWGVSHLMSS